jgi:hypothetical protein
MNGLVWFVLPDRQAAFRGQNRDGSSGSRVRGKLHAQFDERGVETGYGMNNEAPVDERPETDRSDLTNRATPRLYVRRSPIAARSA